MKGSTALAVLLGLASASPTPTAEVQTQHKAPWNLRTISHRSSPRFPMVNFFRNFKYYYQSWPSDKTYYAYVVDSGVRISHKEFEGRAENLWTALKTRDGKDDFEDKSGHGTHVAGTIAAKTYGVAKTARVVSVRVLDKEDRAPTSTIIKGLEQAISDIAKKNRHNNAVINMSVGAECSTAMNTIIQRAYKRRDASGKGLASILVVAASGNEGADASTCSPASSNDALTVGAIDSSWNVVKWSNYGRKVDILAPGDGVTSLSSKSDYGTETMSGTSMAAPHVAALALNAMAVFSKLSNEVKFYLGQTATKDMIKGDLRGAPNLLVNNNNNEQESCERRSQPKNENEDDAC
ncbi:subtilisin-like protease PR1F [Metarhizium acridum CQMa 102]|uniref:Subtilisin-like protease PR1F n=1 Tax=Metarhizium acridum (strain CQMa 102) TaxID=655827 RepID=E9EAF0_METAQ|nr:subtilisin-like protease PR1F [Metarhizium acridum CQMa 102]EFY87059.1 subtilisin-like protease PR1F [Metarhizium acridum CQMa 102]